MLELTIVNLWLIIEELILGTIYQSHSAARNQILWFFNPLTPVPAINGRDEPRPFFHFWSHAFWPKLTSSILNFCGRKASFQWCPDQGDWPSGARDMHKNAQKIEWKTQSEIPCRYTWLLHRKNCPSRWRFLRSFLTKSKPSRRPITTAKRKEKEKKERRNKNFKIRKAQRHWSRMPEPESHKTWC